MMGFGDHDSGSCLVSGAKLRVFVGLGGEADLLSKFISRTCINITFIMHRLGSSKHLVA